MAMLTFAEAARFMEVAAFKARNLLDVPTEALMEGVAAEARELIGHENAGWKPLAESTVAEKERLGYTGHVSATDPLLRTGELRASVRAAAELAPYGAEGVVGSDDKVALYQEMGTKSIPPRPFMGMAMAKCQPAAEKIFGEFAVKILAGN